MSNNSNLITEKDPRLLIREGVFSVYDDAAQAYQPSFQAPTSELALRQFTSIANSESAVNLRDNAQDFSLHQLGWFYPFKGQFVNLERIERIARAVDVIRKDSSDGSVSQG